MSMMALWLKYFYAASALVPFVSFFLIWLVSYYFFKDKKRSTKLAVDVSNIFLLGAVYIMCKQTLSSGFLFWLAVLIFLIGAGWIGLEQNRQRGTVDAMKILRVVWRLSFLVFSIMYFLLLLFGIIKYLSMG